MIPWHFCLVSLVMDYSANAEAPNKGTHWSIMIGQREAMVNLLDLGYNPVRFM